MSSLLKTFVVVLTSLACSAALAQTPQPTKTYAPLPGFDRDAMDTTADPCVDFNKYACGNFAKLHPIPEDLPQFDQFANLYEFNSQALHGLLEAAAAKHAATGTNEQKIGDYYASCMDTDAIEKAGLTPLQPELARIDALKSRDQLTALIARDQRLSVDAFLGFGSQQDSKDATREIAAISQGGLGLPEKDFYFRTDADSVRTRQQYVEHLAKMLQLLGQPQASATANAQKIMDLETTLAKASMGNVELRDADKTYHMKDTKAFAATIPALHIDEFLKDVGAPAVSELDDANPDFFPALNQVLMTTDLETIRNYLRLKLVESESMRLPKAFDDESFDFYGHKLEGTPQQQPRWQRCVDSTDQALGEALGQVYVEKYFAGDSKAKTLEEVHDIEAAMDKDLDSLSWMGPATRVKAKEKLHAIVDKIGYPNKWRDYARLTVTRDNTLEDSLHAREFESDYELNKIGKPVDKGEWAMTPPTVNAYYSDRMNTINFPAGILQPAFYDKTATDATNFGHIGAVVGHELTHGFDDQGRKFDAQGNLKDWWTAEDLKNFTERTDCLVNEYNGFVAVPGAAGTEDLHVNGKLTLGENTADNGGMRLAWLALQAESAKTGLDLHAKDATGYTPEQQLFLGWAQNWCSNDRPEAIRTAVQTDPHSPNPLRTKGVLTNMPEFGQAFSCKVGQPMMPVKTCRVW
jgi:endothelin-converting enzyme/putative endopeptidase